MLHTPAGRLASLTSAAASLRDWRRPSLARNVFLNWSSTSLTVLSTLVVTPIIVRALQHELYGVWSFLNGIIVYSDLLYLGLGAALVKSAAEHLERRDLTALNRLCSVVFSIYTLLGTFALAVSVAFAGYVPVLFARELDVQGVTAVRLTCVLLGFRLLSLFIASAFGGALLAADRIDVGRIVTMLFTIIRTLLIPVVVLSTMPIVALALLVAISAAAETIATAALARRMIPGLKFRLVLPGYEELRPLYAFGLQSFLFLVAVKVISYSDVALIGVTLGAASVAFYSLPLQLAEYGRIAINGIVAILLPRVSSLAVRGDPAAIAAAYVAAARVSCMVAVLFNVHLVFLGSPFLDRWVGPAFAQTADSVLIWLACANVLQCLSTQVPLPFYQALNLLKLPIVVLAVEGAVNVGLSLGLVGPLGLVGVALGTALPALFISGLLLPRHVCHHLGVPARALLRHALVPAAALGACDAGVLAVLGLFFPAHTYPHIAIRAGASLALLAPVLIHVSAAPVSLEQPTAGPRMRTLIESA